MMKVNKLKIFILIALLPILVFLANNHLTADPPNIPPGLEIAMEAQEAHTHDLMSDPEVVGTAVGLDSKGRPIILVFVASEGVRGIPRNIEGFPVVVKVTGEIFALHHRPGHGGGPPGSGGGVDPTARFDRPVPIGVSTGHPEITAGTIGCRVTDGENVYALSNNHVYANQNFASLGDAVIQPGDYDGGISPADDIGTLADFEPIDFSSTGNNEIDAAIAMTTTNNLGVSTPYDGYGTPNSTPVLAFVTQKVQKYGRTTSNTKGSVNAINAIVDVNYGTNGVARFTNQIVISPGSFSAGGDSGSLVVTDDAYKEPVGLLFAGSILYTIANPIYPVLDRFDVTVDDGAAVSCSIPEDCDDGDACNGTETCIEGSCQAGTPVVCDGGDACISAEECDSATGLCQAGTPVNCDDANACTTDECNPVTGCMNNFLECGPTDGCCGPICDASNDSDCSLCSPVGGGCSSDADCCSNKCRGGGPKGKSCKE